MKVTSDYLPSDWIDPRIVIRPSSIQGKGMFATAPIRQGEVVSIWGGSLLLSREDIDGDKAEAWRAKGYVWAAIDEGLFLAARLPAGEQDLTHFINHACEPNVWMRDEVTLIARKEIHKGEELTIDYALFEADENWVSAFTCRCGSRVCRGRVTGKDWRLRELQVCYEDHFSPFINRRIQKLLA